MVTISDILPIFPQADLINIYPTRTDTLSDLHFHLQSTPLLACCSCSSNLACPKTEITFSQKPVALHSYPLMSLPHHQGTQLQTRASAFHLRFWLSRLSKLASRVFGILPPVTVVKRPHRQHLDQNESLVAPLPQHSCHNVF